MNPLHDPQHKLEQWARDTLRDLPPRAAPHSLEQRVRAEIERRLALPWWHKSFAHWPMVARASFVLVCAALARLLLMGGVWMMAGFDPSQFKTAFAQPLAWFENIMVIAQAASGFCDIMLRSIPTLWIYGGLAIFAAMYATLFGLGAAAYKALQARD